MKRRQLINHGGIIGQVYWQLLFANCYQLIIEQVAIVIRETRPKFD